MNKYAAHFSPLSTNSLFALTGLIAALPAIYFVTGSILKYELGLLQSVQIHTFPPAVLLGGGLLALVLNLYTVIGLKLLRTNNACTVNLTVKFKPLNLLVLAVSGLIILTLVSYVIVENTAHP